ncbi:type II toxin-antitoxin system mRNA interferase toxin, RelE/StbE family [Candidatus Saccharibacteria bacterium]|nr:type II toxin-antitoxin system mRNA interferase toxin, RelE/StbE family [Candidatus Saccharibacteria bacterium]
MTIRSNREFKKKYKLLAPKLQDQVDGRLRIFKADPKDPRLRLHPLKGKFQGYFSINISGDVRAIFRRDKDIITFVLIGTHSQLYE